MVSHVLTKLSPFRVGPQVIYQEDLILEHRVGPITSQLHRYSKQRGKLLVKQCPFSIKELFF